MALTQIQIDTYKTEFNVPPQNDIRVFRITPQEGKDLLEYDPIKYFSGFESFGARAIPGQYVEAVVSFAKDSTIEINDPDNDLEEVL